MTTPSAREILSRPCRRTGVSLEYAVGGFLTFASSLFAGDGFAHQICNHCTFVAALEGLIEFRFDILGNAEVDRCHGSAPLH